MGLMLMLGNFLGGVTGLILGAIGGISGAYIVIAAVMIVAMLGTVLTVKEPEPPAVPPFRWGTFIRGLLEPFKSRDFSWVF
jgi:hypothetical protein